MLFCALELIKIKCIRPWSCSGRSHWRMGKRHSRMVWQFNRCGEMNYESNFFWQEMGFSHSGWRSLRSEINDLRIQFLLPLPGSHHNPQPCGGCSEIQHTAPRRDTTATTPRQVASNGLPWVDNPGRGIRLFLSRHQLWGCWWNAMDTAFGHSPLCFQRLFCLLFRNDRAVLGALPSLTFTSVASASTPRYIFIKFFFEYDRIFDGEFFYPLQPLPCFFLTDRCGSFTASQWCVIPPCRRWNATKGTYLVFLCCPVTSVCRIWYVARNLTAHSFLNYPGLYLLPHSVNLSILCLLI